MMSSVLLAALVAVATQKSQAYDVPTFAIPIRENAGRVRRAAAPKDKAQTSAELPVESVLFLDDTRFVTYLGPSPATPQPALLMTDLTSRAVRPIDLPLPQDSRHESLLAAYRPSERSGETVVLFQLESGSVARTGRDVSTQLFVIVVKDGEASGKLGPIEIERENIWQDDEPASSDYAMPRDASERPMTAYRRFARLFARDVNGDGFTDLVIWKRSFELGTAADAGRRIPEIGGKEYVLREERFLVALYRPSERSFTAPQVMESAVSPPESIWKDSPGLLFNMSRP